MGKSEYTGKTVEDAIAEGLAELGITKEQADIEIIEEGKVGLFGGKKAKVAITKKLSDGEKAVKFLDELFEIMNVAATAEVVEGKENTVVNVITTSSSNLIGYRGEVLDSLQCLAGAVANIGKEEYERIVVDCEGYREKREQTLKDLANKLAAKATRLGKKVSLEPMTSFERRIIHSELAESEDVKTNSEGKEPFRYIVIIPNNLKKYEGTRPYGNRGGYNRDNNRGGYGSRPYGNRDGNRGGYNRDGNRDGSSGYGNRDNNRGGYNRDGNRGGYGNRERQKGSGFLTTPPKPRTSGFGTYIGNSRSSYTPTKPTDENKDE